MEICQAVQVCIKMFGYINTYFLYLNEPDKAWSITMLILLFDLCIHFIFYSKLFTFGHLIQNEFSFGLLFVHFWNTQFCLKYLNIFCLILLYKCNQSYLINNLKNSKLWQLRQLRIGTLLKQ